MSNALGEFLKKKRKSLNLSLREASKLLNISPSYLRCLERGYDERIGKANNPSPSTLALIANGYKVNYVALLHLADYINDIEAFLDESYKDFMKTVIENKIKPEILHLLLKVYFLIKKV